MEIEERASDDSSYIPSESPEDSPGVSLTESDKVERVDYAEEVDSEERRNRPPVRGPEVGSGSGEPIPRTTTVDLRQFFEQMGEHVERQMQQMNENN